MVNYLGKDPTTGDGITSERSEWAFNDSVAKSFNDHVRKSVPFYDVTQQLVVELSDWFVYPEATIYDIGCATGTTLAAMQARHQHKSLKLIGIDESAEMLAKCPSTPGIEWRCEDILEIGINPASTSLILSLYTLQFISTQKRIGLCRKLYQALNRRGALLLVEKVLDSDPLLTDIYIQQHWALKAAMGFDVGEIYNKAAALRGVLTPLSVDENIKMLHESGFDRVSIGFKWCNFCFFIAVKS